MKIEVIPTPSKDRAITILVRHIPENPADEKLIAKMSKLLPGMNVVYATPTIKEKTCGTFLFTRSEKRAGSR